MKIDLIIKIALVMCFLAIGWIGNEIYDDYNYKKEFNGLWMSQIQDKPEAIKTAQSYDEGGIWICENIRGMTFKDCVETAKHECGHELFARECAKNETKCLGVLQ